LTHPPRGADVYVEDEAEMSTFPTLSRMWMKRGAQRRIKAPGVSPVKRHEFAAADWRTGDIERIRSEKRNAAAFCRLADKCVARSARRKRRAIMVVDNARFHRPEKSKLVTDLLRRHGTHLTLRYLPGYSPECMPIETLWNDWRKKVTHNHDRSQIEQLEGDSDRYFKRRGRNRRGVLKTLGSPFQKRKH
jgi:transposase